MSGDILNYPIVYPKRPLPPPGDDDLIYSAVIPFFHARDWARRAAELDDRLSEVRGHERARLCKSRDWARSEAEYQENQLALKLSALPAHLLPKASGIISRAGGSA